MISYQEPSMCMFLYTQFILTIISINILYAKFLGCSSKDEFPEFHVERLTVNDTACRRECRLKGYPFASFRFVSNPCGCGMKKPEKLRIVAIECDVVEWSVYYSVDQVESNNNCPPNSTIVSKKPYDVCVFLSNMTSRFFDCRSQCVKKNTDIVSYIAKSTEKKLLPPVSKKDMKNDQIYKSWVGVYRRNHRSPFEWLSAYENAFSNKGVKSKWNVGYPGTQSCVISLPMIGRWETKRCRQRHICICQMTMSFSTYVRFREGLLGIYDRILHFFSNRQNIAMYLVLPLMTLSISSCCIIYGIAKAVENYKQKRKKKRRMKRRQKRNQISPDLSTILDQDYDVPESCDLGTSDLDLESYTTMENEEGDPIQFEDACIDNILNSKIVEKNK